MQIHEIVLTENFSQWFGLDKQSTRGALGTLGNAAVAAVTRDPRYRDLPLDQRIDVMTRDAGIARATEEKVAEFAEYYKQLMYANQNKPLGPEKFQAAMYNYLSKRVFGRNVAGLESNVKQQLDQLISQAQRARFDFRQGFSPEFEKAMKDIVALKFVAQYSAPAQTPAAVAPQATGKITTPPSPGAPTPAEQARLQQMIQQKLGASE